jgi:xylulokinase
MGVMLSAASCLKWWVENINDKLPGDRFDLLLHEAEESIVGSNGVLFLPYLMGERTPHSDPNAKGTFIGLNMTNKRGDMTRAILEGVCFGLRDSLEILKDMKIPVKCARVSGGGAKSRLWRHILADIFNTDVEIINSEEGPAFGGAILASVGCGVFNSVDEACRSLIKVAEVIKPQGENVQKYNRVYKVYAGMYDTLKNTFINLSEI